MEPTNIAFSNWSIIITTFNVKMIINIIYKYTLTRNVFIFFFIFFIYLVAGSGLSIKGLAVHLPAPIVHLLKCPLARRWSLNCFQWSWQHLVLKQPPSGVWVKGWMRGQREALCKTVMVTESAAPFTTVLPKLTATVPFMSRGWRHCHAEIKCDEEKSIFSVRKRKVRER